MLQQKAGRSIPVEFPPQTRRPEPASPSPSPSPSASAVPGQAELGRVFGAFPTVYREVTVGDHDIVLLLVHEHACDPAVAPLVFHGSRFRRLEP
jgi:hypothetical protein